MKRIHLTIALHHVCLVLLAALVCVSAAGCGTSRPARFYLLDDTPTVEPAEADAKNVLLVGPIQVPLHLERSLIARSTGGTEVVYEEYHRWAEELSAGILRVLRAELDAQLPATMVIPFSWVRSAPYEYRIPVNILAFSGAPGGEARLSAQWAATSERGRKTLMSGSATFSAMPRGNDYESLVQAQSDLIKELAREIASNLRDLAGTMQEDAAAGKEQAD